MKKVILGVAVAAAIGAGGYFALNQGKQVARNFGEEEVKAFIAAHTNKAQTIDSLQAHPMVERADIKIVESTDTLVKSVITIKPVGEKAFEIPLNSEIVRGEFKYADETYGFGKVITKPDLTGVQDLPPFINENTLTNTSYFGLNGDVTSVTEISPITVAESNFDFKGMTAVVDTSLLSDNADIETDIDFAGVSFDTGQDSANFSKFTMNVKLDGNGEYTGESSPFDFALNEGSNKSLKLQIGKGTYKGNYKKVEGLVTAISNGVSKYDKLTATADGKSVLLNNFSVEGGIYDSGDKKVDLKVKLASDIDASSLKAQMPLPVEPQSFEISYGFDNIGFDVVNTYMNAFNSWDPQTSADAPFSDEEVKAMAQSLQKSGFGFDFAAKVKAAEGEGEAQFNFAINETGKAADYAAFESAMRQQNPQLLLPFFNGEMKTRLSKSLADVTGASMYMMMAGAKEEDGKYVIEAELKDGMATLNGQPVPMM